MNVIVIIIYTLKKAEWWSKKVCDFLNIEVTSKTHVFASWGQKWQNVTRSKAAAKGGLDEEEDDSFWASTHGKGPWPWISGTFSDRIFCSNTTSGPSHQQMSLENRWGIAGWRTTLAMEVVICLLSLCFASGPGERIQDVMNYCTCRYWKPNTGCSPGTNRNWLHTMCLKWSLHHFIRKYSRASIPLSLIATPRIYRLQHKYGIISRLMISYFIYYSYLFIIYHILSIVSYVTIISDVIYHIWCVIYPWWCGIYCVCHISYIIHHIYVIYHTWYFGLDLLYR